MFTYNIVIYERTIATSIKVDSLAYTLKLDESLDSGVLTIPRSTRKAKFKRFSRVEIKINDGEQIVETTWLIYTTKVEIDSRGTTKTYNHTIGLIEPTKWLEKFVVGSLTFTQPLSGTQKTLYDYLERVRQLVPLVPRNKTNQTRLFKIDPDFATKLATITAPQLYLDKKNLREVLIELLKVVNAIPRLYYDNGWWLTGDFVNQKQLEIEIGDGDIDYVEEGSGEQFAQSAEIFHENTLAETSMYEGSITDYISFRNNEVILGESDFKLILSQNVKELKKIEMIYEEDDINIQTADITDYIYEKGSYDTLKMEDSGDEKKSLAIYWTYKSNEIQGFSETFGAVFETLAIERILEDLGVDISLFLGTEKLYNLLFKVEYVPYFETMRSVQYREDLAPYALTPDMLDDYSGLIINAGERINELYDLTENVYGQIQRIGVDTVMFSKKHYKYSQIYKYGDYTTDGYIITKVEIIPYTTYFIARYEASKNWNRIAQFIEIDKEFRPYEVSLTKSAFTLKRNVLLNMGFVEISTQASEFVSSVDYSNLRTIFMNTFKNSTYSQNITAMIMSSPSFYYLIGKPLSPLAEKNVLKWKIDFQDTKLAGKQTDRDVSTLISILSGRKVQKAVAYTNESGILDTINLKLNHGIYDLSHSVLADYELAKDFADYFPMVSNLYPTKLSDTILEMPDYQIKKDSAEVLGLELTLPVLPRYNNINNFVIGDSLLKENVLIKQRDIAKNLYFYGLIAPIEKTDTSKIDLTFASQMQTVNEYIFPYYIDVPTNITSTYNYYAIADELGNLYLGVNQIVFGQPKQVIDRIYINFTEQRTRPAIAVDTNLVLNLEFEDSDYLETNLTFKFYKNLVLNIEMLEEDYITASLNYGENVSYNIAMIEEDLITTNITYRHFRNITLNIAMEEEDNIATNITYKRNTAEPTVSFVSWTEGLGPLDEVLFQVKNNDGNYAEIFASGDSLPTSSRGWVAPNSSVNVSLLSSNTSVTYYARARAEDENYSTVDSAVGTIT